jgi:hypothetical protein
LHWPAPPPRNELNNADREGEQIVVNNEGRPYTRDGLQTILWNLVKKLEREGRVKPGLCFHGLRHSLGAALYDLGLDREARKAALGHRSDAASAVYERDGNRLAASDRAFAALDKHLAAGAARDESAVKIESVKPDGKDTVNSSRDGTITRLFLLSQKVALEAPGVADKLGRFGFRHKELRWISQ